MPHVEPGRLEPRRRPRVCGRADDRVPDSKHVRGERLRRIDLQDPLPFEHARLHPRRVRQHHAWRNRDSSGLQMETAGDVHTPDLVAERLHDRRELRRAVLVRAPARSDIQRPALAKDVAQEVTTRFGVPTYLYEEASANPARKNLEDIRRGEYEGLQEKMKAAEWAPDFGTAAPHPTAGASVIGARMPLIAYNINLNTNRLDVAKKIAAGIRHSSGGFRYVKAAGFELKDRGIVQVSMNLTNYEKTPIFRVFETVKREAERYGVSILESEIVGLVPAAALHATAEFYLQIAGFNPNQVLENKLRD